MNQIPEFSKDNPYCHQHYQAEWDAVIAGRPFEVVPRGWLPVSPRPNAVDPEEDIQYG